MSAYAKNNQKTWGKKLKYLSEGIEKIARQSAF